jgi:hypothetical protein
VAKASIWNPRNVEHLQVFSALLKPAVRASATTLFDDQTVARETVQAWIMQLHDVPEDVLFEGFARVFGQGITWMPRPGDVRKACAALIEERRRAAAVDAQQLIASCEDCGGSKFRPVVDAQGVTRMTRCECHRRAMALVNQHPDPIALPPADDQAVPA